MIASSIAYCCLPGSSIVQLFDLVIPSFSCAQPISSQPSLPVTLECEMGRTAALLHLLWQCLHATALRVIGAVSC